MIDPGMAAHLLNVDAESLGRTPGLLGQLFETFVATELLTHTETTSVRTKMFHLRDRDGKEVDTVLERRDKLVALEVKSATSVTRQGRSGAHLAPRSSGGFVHLRSDPVLRQVALQDRRPNLGLAAKLALAIGERLTVIRAHHRRHVHCARRRAANELG